MLASHAAQDPALRQVLLAELGGSTEDKLAAAKARVSTSIKRHTHHGQLNMWNCDRVCNDIDEVLRNAQLCLAQGQFQSAFWLARYIFLTCARLTSYADSSSGGVGDTLNAALELIDHSASGLAKCGSADATKVLKRLARDAVCKRPNVWDGQYPKLLTEIKFARPAHEYMSILSTQNELALLMDEVQEHPHTVFQYGKQLVSLYPAQVVSLCTLLVYGTGQDASNRREYYHVAQQLRQLIALGGRAEAIAIIDRLCAEYPRRTAMIDELQKVWTS